jgi:hypothetical protein
VICHKGVLAGSIPAESVKESLQRKRQKAPDNLMWNESPVMLSAVLQHRCRKTNSSDKYEARLYNTQDYLAPVSTGGNRIDEKE